MEIKEMRKALKEAGETVPVRNDHVSAKYNELISKPQAFESNGEEIEVEVVEDELWTYIGAGHEPPQVTNFMGRQVFKRGELTKVTDPVVLKKLKNGNRCFVKGHVSGEMLIRQDEAENRLFQQKKTQDSITQMNAMRHNR